MPGQEAVENLVEAHLHMTPQCPFSMRFDADLQGQHQSLLNKQSSGVSSSKSSRCLAPVTVPSVLGTLPARDINKVTLCTGDISYYGDRCCTLAHVFSHHLVLG